MAYFTKPESISPDTTTDLQNPSRSPGFHAGRPTLARGYQASVAGSSYVPAPRRSFRTPFLPGASGSPEQKRDDDRGADLNDALRLSGDSASGGLETWADIVPGWGTVQRRRAILLRSTTSLQPTATHAGPAPVATPPTVEMDTLFTTFGGHGMIRIGTKYAIKADTDCWQFGKVGRRKKSKDSDEYEDYIVNPSFPTTLDKALERYAEREVRDADPTSWAEVLNALRRVREEIARVADVLEAVRA